jgi:MerR family transcriptional regulator, light-induced transcriptional regulator
VRAVDGLMRIGELSRRTGVSPELLRAWEQRYGLLRPSRSAGGFRLYSVEDEERVRRTNALVADGLSTAEAARLAAGAAPGPVAVDRPAVEEFADQLRHALEGFDAAAGHAALDRLLGAVSVEIALTEVLIPYLRELGERWADGTVSVAQEHFASQLIRGRLLGLARDWGAGGSASAVLACVPGEAHDLGLVLLGVLIARRGWRVTFLGADTPFDTLENCVRTVQPTLVVLATYNARVFRKQVEAIRGLAAVTRLAVVAPVDEDAITDTGAEALGGGIAEAAEALAAT